MDSDIKKLAVRLWKEARKDLPFFGSCGFVVGLLSIWQSRAKQLGLANNPEWANHLFSDFISLNAFCLILFAYLMLGCINTVASHFDHAGVCLNKILRHTEKRLAQFGSVIICFMMGLLALVVLVSVINLDSGGLVLLALSLLFSGFVVATYVTSSLVVQRVEPFNHPAVAAVMFFGVLLVLGWLVFLADGKIS